MDTRALLVPSARCGVSAARFGRGLTASRCLPRLPRRVMRIQSSMGIGIHPDDYEEEIERESDVKLVVPKSAYGLSTKQMAQLGLVGDQVTKRYETDLDSLTARAHYGGEVVSEHTRIATRMAGGRHRRRGPPDLPSLLLDGRIVYIGMPLVAAVTELVISELLWLNYSGPDKPAYIYINSIGSQTPDGQAVGFETEAYAILDTMSYIRCPKYTVALTQAFGNAAMILAAGQKGGRYGLTHTRIMLAPPRANRSYGVASNLMIRANELEHCTNTYVDFLSAATGKDKEVIRKDAGRNRYFTPDQAIEYGIIDKVLIPEDKKKVQGQQDSERLYAEAEAEAMRRRFRGGGEEPAAAAG